MATSSQQANRWKQIGLNELDPDEGLQAMEQILRSHSIQVGVLDLDVQKLPPALTSTPFWSELRGKSQRSASISDFLARWQSAPNEEREELLTAHLKQQLSEVLELDPADSLSTQRKFDELGIDSLMAVEFRNRIQAFLSMNLAATIIFDHPSIQQLAEYLNNELEGKETGTKIDTDVLDLSQEVVLDKEIINNLRSVEPAADHLPIFLTGATGFLGTHLLCELLKQTDKDVYCLIRAADRQSARRRLAEALDRYELLEHVAESRIIPVAGDLEERNFGLSDDEFLELSSKVSSVYHNAAMVSFSSPYPTLKKVNVDGTQEALRFATTGTRKRLHYVSSVSVFASLRNFGRFFEEPNVPEVWQDMPLGYAESKWVAELLVLRARELGLPAVIYRPTFISGHSKTGVANVEDITPRVLKWCCQRGTYPEVDLILDSSPVDYVSRAIVDLALQKRSVGKNFHLSNPNPITWMRFIQLIEGLGLSLEKVPFADWLEEIKESQNLDQNPLFGLQDFFRIVSPDDRKGPNAKLGAGHQPRFYCQRTNESFFDESLRCPTFSTELLRIYLEYLLRVGFTEPFEHHLEKEAELKSVKS